MAQNPCNTCCGRGRIALRKKFPNHDQKTGTFRQCYYCNGTGFVQELNFGGEKCPPIYDENDFDRATKFSSTDVFESLDFGE